MLYFLHIPKTGGNSIKAVLEDNFAVSRIAPIFAPPDLVRFSPLDLLSFDLVAGHLGYGLTQYVPPPLDVITFLRRPIDQALSMFFDHLANGFIQADRTLEQVLDSNEVQLVTNIQTRTLACDDLATRNVGYALIYEDREQAVRELTDGALLDKAKARLASMAAVGLVEEFTDSMALICSQFGWPTKANYTVLNAREDKDWSLVSASAKQKLESLLNLDNELYEFGRSLFQQKFDQLRPCDGGGGHYRERLRREPPAQSCQVTFDLPLQGHGWHGRELLDNGQYARWTGPERISNVQVRVESRSDLRLSLHIQGTLLVENIEQLRLRVNGVDLSVEHLFNEIGQYGNVLCTAKVPREIINPDDVTDIEIEVPQVCRPSELAPDSPDVRQIGIMVNWLCLSPVPDENQG